MSGGARTPPSAWLHAELRDARRDVAALRRWERRHAALPARRQGGWWLAEELDACVRAIGDFPVRLGGPAHFRGR